MFLFFKKYYLAETRISLKICHEIIFFNSFVICYVKRKSKKNELLKF